MDSVVSTVGEGNPTAILIAGMHRSGTSALARTLNFLGCSLPGNLVPPKVNSNELGFWESQSIVDLNQEILAASKSAWDGISQIDLTWMKGVTEERYLNRAVHILSSEFETSSLVVLKDPRFCLLMPFWLKVLDRIGVDPRIVLPVRNPVEVASSLAKRDYLSDSNGQLIWLRYVLEAEASSRTIPRFFLRYEDLLEDWRSIATRMATFFEISWPCSTLAETKIDAFLSKAHRHNIASEGELFMSADSSDWILETYAIMCRWADGNSRKPYEIASLDNIREAFNMTTPVFKPMVLAHREAVRRAAELELLLAQRNERVNVEGEYESKGTKGGMERDKEKAEGRIPEGLATKSAEIQKLRTVNENLEQANSLLKQHIDILMGDVKQLTTMLLDQISTFRTEIVARDEIIASLRNSNAVLRSEPTVSASNLVTDIQSTRNECNPEETNKTADDASQFLTDAILRRGLWRLVPRPIWLAILSVRLSLSSEFDSVWYIKRYADVAASGMDPKKHYILFGAREGRERKPNVI